MSTENDDKLVTVAGLSAYTTKLKAKLDTKVDKEAGKGLSTNDYTTAEKEKLAGLSAHPTTTAHTAAAVKVGNDSNGHVVLGDAITASDVGAASSTHTHTVSDITDLSTTLNGYVPTSQLGIASGVATLGSDGKLTADQMPDMSPYDDVVEVANFSDLNETNCVSGKIYIVTSTKELYRWASESKTAVKVGTSSEGQANITTSEWESVTAHTSSTSNPHKVTADQVGLGNVDNTSDADKPVSTATQTALDKKMDKLASSSSTSIGAAKTLKTISQSTTGEVTVETQDIAIGMSAVSGLTDELAKKAGTDVFSATANGLVPKKAATAADAAYLAADGTWKDLPEDKDTTYTAGDGITLTGTVFSAKVDGTTVKVNASKQLEASISLTQGDNVTITGSSTAGYTISAKDTTYSNATQSAAGLMSSDDKTKLDGLEVADTTTVSALLDDTNED